MMCFYDVLIHPSCTHATVVPTICEAKTSAPYPHAQPCEFDERLWSMDGNCTHSTCLFTAEKKFQAAEKKALKEALKERRLLKLQRTRYGWKYIKPAPTPQPRQPPYGGFYDLELKVLYTIAELDEPKEIILDIDNDATRWSWTLHDATELVMENPVLRTLLRNKPLPALPNGLRSAYVGGATQLAPPPMPKAKHVPHPIYLQATKPQLDENLTPRCTTHSDSTACSQAQKLISQRAVRHASFMAAAKAGLSDGTLTPRRTTHISSSARSQAQEIAIKRPVRAVDSSGHPRSLRPGHRSLKISKPVMAVDNSAIPASLLPGYVSATSDKPVTAVGNTATIPISLQAGHPPNSFTGRKLSREVKDATERAIFNRRRHGRIFEGGVPLAPKAALRLSAVGVHAIAAPPLSPTASWSPPVVDAYILDLQKDIKPVPRLRRVGTFAAESR